MVHRIFFASTAVKNTSAIVLQVISGTQGHRHGLLARRVQQRRLVVLVYHFAGFDLRYVPLLPVPVAR